ncbi:ribokinase [Paenibacillus sp. p3-SID1389]|uniref:ribokinase n=1 Tax=Paenibacillus sp. p3-SID1389 TaxID=2916364 RepID=UPI0021A574C6|nr:ribokinase [Paenibacillus sp. p3-SID1389]MCT2197549.1 ribokinase [Paenibacillus sp. p3-SID1389]
MSEKAYEKEKIVTVIGSLNFDLIFKQKRLAEIGETYTADRLETAGGGKGANQAVQCAKLGTTTYLVGAVGNDVLGEKLVHDLKHYGVHTEYIGRAAETTGVGVVNALEDGTLIATISKGANYSLTKERIDEIEDLLMRSAIVILQLEVPVDVVEYAIRKAHDFGCYIILNAAPAAPVAPDALAKVSCLVVNESEASFYCGKPIHDLASAQLHGHGLYERTGELLIITLGKSGCVVFDREGSFYVPAEPVNAIETTGAGDSFIGAFATRMLESPDVKAATRFASRAAAVTVTKIGAQSAMPTIQQLQADVSSDSQPMV